VGSSKKAAYLLIKSLKESINQLPSERKAKQNQYSQPTWHSSYAAGDNHLWFLKPSGYNRGRGIEIFNQIPVMGKYIKDYYEG